MNELLWQYNIEGQCCVFLNYQIKVITEKEIKRYVQCLNILANL